MMKFLTIILLLIASQAFAASGLPSMNSKAPISIDADSLEVLQKDQVALFSGNVVATQADTQIRANTMKVFYGTGQSSDSNAPKISKIEVNGNVLIKTKAETAQGGKYVLARPLFIYSSAKIMKEKPQVAGFVNFYLSKLSEVLGPVGYFASSADATDGAKQAWMDASK